MNTPATTVTPPLFAPPPPTGIEARARARVGHVIRGKWRLDGLLAVGGTSAVYAATHRNRARAAVKMLHPELSAQPSVRGAFLRQGYAANGVAHDGVVRAFDDDIAEDGAAYLAMELLEGLTLQRRLAEAGGPLLTGEALTIADRVLDILDAAHAQGIQHRDVTPKNVFLLSSGKVKLIDFGSAFLAEVQQSGLTLTGMPMGTPAFMSPELARGRMSEVDPRTDVYSVGALLHAMLTGAPPRLGHNVNEELLLAMNEPLRPIGERLPTLPREIALVIDRAVAFEKKGRWPGARAMQDALFVAKTPDAMATVPLTDDDPWVDEQTEATAEAYVPADTAVSACPSPSPSPSPDDTLRADALPSTIIAPPAVPEPLFSRPAVADAARDAAFSLLHASTLVSASPLNGTAFASPPPPPPPMPAPAPPAFAAGFGTGTLALPPGGYSAQPPMSQNPLFMGGEPLPPPAVRSLLPTHPGFTKGLQPFHVAAIAFGVVLFLLAPIAVVALSWDRPATSDDETTSSPPPPAAAPAKAAAPIPAAPTASATPAAPTAAPDPAPAKSADPAPAASTDPAPPAASAAPAPRPAGPRAKPQRRSGGGEPSAAPTATTPPASTNPFDRRE